MGITSSVKKIFKNNPIFLLKIAGIKKRIKLEIKYIKKRIKDIGQVSGADVLPVVLQLPITNSCNLDCVMCNIRSLEKKKAIPLETFSGALEDKIFSNIESVGINGGEPFILVNLFEYVECLCKKLPKIKDIYIITNGTIKQNTLKQLKLIKKVCTRNQVKLTLSFSLDGVGPVHDMVRAKEGTFERLMELVDIIRKSRELYCDSLGFICTISKYNVFNLNELEQFAIKHRLNIAYNIATEHVRLNNQNKMDNFSILNDKKAIMQAREFFYKKFLQTESETYYALYYYLKNEKFQRITDCFYLNRAITLTPEGDICFCATRSKAICNINREKEIYKKYMINRNYKEEVYKRYCNTCSHYMECIQSKYFLEYVGEILRGYHIPKL